VDRRRVAPISALSECSDGELDAVARVASELEFDAGETLMSEGDFGHSLFLVESGSADVLVHGEKVREVGPGEVLGEVAVLSSGRRTASVVATSPIRAIALFKRDVWHLERDAPETAQRLRAAIEGHVGSSAPSSADD
jgi:CRP/FNR family transcriptional regulator, cyclic AMP receptor protein